MDADRYARGQTYAEYVSSIEGADRAALERRYAAVVIPPEVGGLKELSHIRALVVAEVWCGDCRVNLPILARLSEIWGFQLRIVHKEDAADLGIQRIPTFIFYTGGFQEVARWIERPRQVAEVLSGSDEAAKAELRRRYMLGEYAGATVSELADLLGSARG